MPLDAERYAAGLRICNSAQSAAQDADALIVLTDWVDFLRCDLAVLAAAMADPVLLDLRNMFDEAGAIASGFRSYERLGRGRRTNRPPSSKPFHRFVDAARRRANATSWSYPHNFSSVRADLLRGARQLRMHVHGLR